MKIKYLQVQPNVFDNINFDTNKHIQVLRGYSGHLMSGFVQLAVLESKPVDMLSRLAVEGECLVHCGVEFDADAYNVTVRCYVDEDGDVECHLGASKSKTYCESDVKEYVNAIAKIKCSDRDFHVNFDDNPMGLSVSDLAVRQLNEYIDKIAQNKGNRQAPLFIHDCLECIDDSVDITPIFDRLSEVGSQVFITAPDKYPARKLDHDDIAVTDCYNELYTRIYLERFGRNFTSTKNKY